MTSPIFDQCSRISHEIYSRFHATGVKVQDYIDPVLGINDTVFSSQRYRRAHISVVDARETHSLWLLHVTVFPHEHDPSPIYGFDIIAGPKKVSGAFHDFSACGSDTHFLMEYFSKRTANIDWNKKRDLPDWAKNIFSDSMVAIGAVGLEELEKFGELGLDTLNYYLSNVGHGRRVENDFSEQQNYYCDNQRLNPHTPRVLVTLGFTEDQAKEFVNDHLFPKLNIKSEE